MRLNSIQLTNVRNHSDFQHTFTDGITAIIGGNGSGKSTILTGLCVGIWGARSLEPLVKSGEKDMRIEVDISIGDDTYHIVRGVHLRASGPVSQLSFSKNGVDISASRIPDTQALIREVVGTYPVAASTYIVLQGETARFANMTPADRRDMINGVLKLNELWDGLYGGVSKIKSGKDREYQRLSDIRDSKVVELDQLAHDNDLHAEKKRLEGEIETAQTEIDETEEQYKTAESNLKNAKANKANRLKIQGQIEQNTRDFNALERKIELESKKLTEYQGLQSDDGEGDDDSGRKALDNEVEEYDTKLKGLRTNRDQEKETLKWHNNLTPKLGNYPTSFPWIDTMKGLLDKYAKVEQSAVSGICVFCGSKIVDADHIKQEKKQIEDEWNKRAWDIERENEFKFNDIWTKGGHDATFEAIEQTLVENKGANEEAQKKLEAHTKKAGEIQAKIDGYEKEIDEALLEQSNVRDEIIKLEEAAGETQRKIGSIEGIDNLIKSYRTQQQEKRNSSEELDNDLQAIPNTATEALQETLDEIGGVKTQQNEAMDKLVRGLNAIEVDIATRKKLEGEIQKLGTDVDTAKVEMETYRLASDALAPRGGRQLLLDTKLKVIELHTNEILKQMGAKERIIIDTQTDTGQETLAIMVSSESLRPLETYSKGEQTKISLAQRRGTIEALAGKVTSNLFFMDETLGDQDGMNKEKIAHSLLDMKNSVRQVMLITHDHDIVELADEVIDLGLVQGSEL